MATRSNGNNNYDKNIFSIEVTRDIKGRKNLAVKTHLNLLESLVERGDLSPESFSLIRQSYLDAINGFYRSIINLFKNINSSV